ncbi:hypothetical protein HDV05_004874 [Chytridiales sp. JEL 0842]|nr:hypothetical protein HDV05_004874 [Chytridiales sp. JEL 0842]
MVASPVPIPEDSKLPTTKDDAQPKKQHAKLDYLEGLRGIAALHVVFVHSTGFFPMLNRILRYDQEWTFAVPCFFVLSGAVITIPSLAKNDLRRLMSSFLRRFFRLLLPLWGFMLVWTIWYAIWPNEKYAPGQASIMDFLYAITFLLLWTGWTRAIPGVGWTLPQEIIGSNLVYLLTAIMLPMNKNPKAKYIMLTVIIIFNWLGETWMNYFVAGLMLADLRTHGYLEQFRKWRYSHVVKALLFLGSAPFAFTYWGNPVRKWAETFLGETIRINQYPVSNRQSWFPNATVIFPWIFACMFIIETTPWVQKILSWKPFMFLGKVSYMLYLSHQWVVHVIDVPLSSFIQLTTVPQWFTLPVAFILLMALDFFVAWVLTYMFDTPCLNFLKFWEAVFLSEEKWSWQLIVDWSKGKVRRTVEDVKSIPVKIRKAGAKRFRRRRVVKKGSAETVVPSVAEEGAKDAKMEQAVVEVRDEGEQSSSRSSSSAGTGTAVDLDETTEVVEAVNASHRDVPCFFLLSGAVITKPVLATNDLRRLMSSFLRRFFRLLLPLWGFMLVWTIWYAIFPNETDAPGQASIMDFLYAITFLLFWSGWRQSRGIPGPAWTLPHEIVGSNLVYLVTAIMIPMHKNPKAKYIMLTVMIIFSWLAENWMNYFLAGLMLADMREHGYLERFRKWKYSHVVKFLLFVTTAPFAFTYYDNPVRKWAENFLGETIRINTHIMMPREQWFPNASVVFPFIFACMFIVETTIWVQKVLSFKFLLFLGKISYMLYLSHMPLTQIVGPTINSYLFAPYTPTPYWVNFPVACVLLIVLDLTVAWILTEMFDTPCLNLLRFWESVFLAEEEWSWQLVKDWCRGKYKRTVVDIKTKAVKLRKAGNPKRWRRRKVVRLSENVNPLPVGASELTIEQVVEVPDESGEQVAGRDLLTTGATRTVLDFDDEIEAVRR